MNEITILHWMNLERREQEKKLEKLNSITKQFDLTLTKEDINYLLNCRTQTLKEQERVELSESILPKIIFYFCDSPYIQKENYVSTIEGLQDIFFQYKNEYLDEISDDELLDNMKRAFDGVCQGSLEYLEETILDSLARSYREQMGEGFGKYYRIAGNEEHEFEE